MQASPCFVFLTGIGTSLPYPSWLRAGGGISDTSSSEEETSIAIPPPWPLCPLIGINVEVHATWDLLVRPDGISVLKLWKSFKKLHGPPSMRWFNMLEDCPYFNLFVPHRNPLQDFHSSVTGEVFWDTYRHTNCQTIRCCAPFPLANPFSLDNICCK